MVNTAPLTAAPLLACRPQCVRHLVFRSRTARTFLCCVHARDKAHALSIARQTFNLERDAFALPHPEPIPSWL